MIKPTYTPQEIKAMALTISDAEGMRVLAEMINEEIELFNDDDLIILMQSSMIIFMRSLLMGSIKLLPL